MTPLQLYYYYYALKRHFTTTHYDYFKYKGRLRLNDFNKVKEKIFFEVLSRNYKAKEIIFSNILNNPKIYIAKLINNEETEKIFHEWDKINSSPLYYFKEDIKNFDGNFRNNFVIGDDNTPLIFKLLKNKKITLETFVIVDKMINFINVLNKKTNNKEWGCAAFKAKKYEPFLEIDDLKKFKEVILNNFEV